ETNRARPARAGRALTASFKNAFVGRSYFQPDALSHAARSAGWLFSHCVMDCVSLLSIFSFMQMQYLRTISAPAPPLLSLMHWLIHLRSSAFICWPKAAVAASMEPSASRTAVVRFIAIGPLVGEGD